MKFYQLQKKENIIPNFRLLAIEIQFCKISLNIYDQSLCNALSNILDTTRLVFNMSYVVRTKRSHKGHGCCGKRRKLRSLGMLQSLASHLRGQELTRGNTIFLSSIRLVSARECVESNALVFRMELAVKSIVGMLIFIYVSFVVKERTYSCLMFHISHLYCHFY